MFKREIRATIILMISMILVITGGCSQNTSVKQSYDIRIAEQYGLAYAPLQIMQQKGLIEKNFPDANVTWSKVGNTAGIREAMLGGKMDIGFMAIPPFLIGVDKGMKWKIASGLSSAPIGLITYRQDIETLSDFTSNDRIALPQPGSIQHILLSMACERELGDAKYFDNQLVTMKHPDGMSALLGKKDITAHFTSPPYIFKELEQDGMKQLLSGKDAMGSEFTFILGVTTEEFHNKNPKAYNAFITSLNEAIDFINTNKDEAATILSETYGISKEEVLGYISHEEMIYETRVKGIEAFGDFMYRNNYITKELDDFEKLTWEDVLYE